MYCVKCGVELADTENKCPLCGTVVYHPNIVREPVKPNYPNYVKSAPNMRPQGILFILTVLACIPISVTLFCDLYYGNGLTWAGYPIGGILLFYTMLVLPQWFYQPNPVIFCPINFAVMGAYLLYINYATEGDQLFRHLSSAISFLVVFRSGPFTYQVPQIGNLVSAFPKDRLLAQRRGYYFVQY